MTGPTPHSNGQPAEIALGDPVLETMALTMIEQKANQATAARKIMANSVFLVAREAGTTEVEGTKLLWKRGDVIVVPAWQSHAHLSDDGRCCFASPTSQ